MKRIERKRCLSILLALFMVLGLLPTGVFTIPAKAADTVSYDSEASHFAYVASENGTSEDLSDDYLLVTGYKGTSTAAQIPDTVTVSEANLGSSLSTKYAGVSSLPVKMVQSRFNSTTGLTHVRLGANIEQIYAFGFAGLWETLTDVDIPENSKLEIIGMNAFAGDSHSGSALERIGMTVSGTKTDKLPATVNFIYEYAFCKASSLKSIDLSLTAVDDLRDCTFTDTGLESIVLPASLKYMGWSVFDGCRSLTSLTFPAGMTYIGPYAFQDCTSLTKLVLKCGVSGIGENSGGAFSSLRGVNPDCTIFVPQPADKTAYNETVQRIYNHMGASASMKLRWLNSSGNEMSIVPRTAPAARSNSVVTLSGTYNDVAYSGFSYDYQDTDKDGVGAVIVLDGKLTNDLNLTLNGASSYASNTTQVFWHVVSAYSLRRGTDAAGYDVLRGTELTEAMMRTQALGYEESVSTTASKSLRLNNSDAPGIYYYIPTLINRNDSYTTGSSRAQSAVFLPPVMVVYRPATGDLVKTTISGSTSANLKLTDDANTCGLTNGMRVQVPGFDAWLYDSGDFVRGVTKAECAGASITYQWYETDSKTNTGGTAIDAAYGCGGTAVYDGYDRAGGSGIYWRCGGLTEAYIADLKEYSGVSTKYFYLQVTITANSATITITSDPCVLNLYKALSITGFSVDQSEAPAGNVTGVTDGSIATSAEITVKSGTSNVTFKPQISGLWNSDGDFDGSSVTKWTCNGTTYTSSCFLSDWLPTTVNDNTYYTVNCRTELQTADGTVLSSDTKSFRVHVTSETASTFTDQPVFDTGKQAQTQYLQTTADGNTLLTVYLDNLYGQKQSDGTTFQNGSTWFDVCVTDSPDNNRDCTIKVISTNVVTSTDAVSVGTGSDEIYKGSFQIDLTAALATYWSGNGKSAFEGHGVTYFYVKAYNKSSGNYTGVAYSPVFAVIPTAELLSDQTALSPRNVTVTEQPFEKVWAQANTTANITVGLKTENVPMTDLVHTGGKDVSVIRWEYLDRVSGKWETLVLQKGITCTYEETCTSDGGAYTQDGTVTLSIPMNATAMGPIMQMDGTIKLRLRSDTEAFYGSTANPQTLAEVTVVGVNGSLPDVVSTHESGGREYLQWNSSAGAYELIAAELYDYSVIPENEYWLYSDRYDNRTAENFGNKPGSTEGVTLRASAYYSPNVTLWQVELPDGTKQILTAGDELVYDEGEASADGTWSAYTNKITVKRRYSDTPHITLLTIEPPTGDSAFVMQVTPIAVVLKDSTGSATDTANWSAAKADQTYTIRVNPVTAATAASVYGSGSYYFNLAKSELPYTITASVYSPDDSVVTCQWYRRRDNNRMEPETDTPVGPAVTITGREVVSLELTKEMLQAFASGDGSGTAYFYLCADSYNANAVYNKKAQSTSNFYQVSVNNNYRVAEKPVITAQYSGATPVHVLYGNQEPEAMRTVTVKKATSACSQSIYLYYTVRDPETAEVISRPYMLAANIVTDDSGNVTSSGTNSASDTLTFNADGTITCSISKLLYIGNSVYTGGKEYYDYDLELYWEVVNHLSGDVGQYATGGNVIRTQSNTSTVQQRRAETPALQNAEQTLDNVVTLDPYAKTDDILLANVPAGVGATDDVSAFLQYPDDDTMRVFSYVPSFSANEGKSGDTLSAWLEYYDTTKDSEGNDLGWTRMDRSYAKRCDSSGNVTYYGTNNMPQTAGEVNYAAFYDLWQGEEDGCLYCPKDTRIFLRVAVAAQNGEYTYSASDPAYSQPFALVRVAGEPVDADKPVYQGSSESFYGFTWNQDDSTVTSHSFGEDSWVIGESGTGAGVLSYQWKRYSKDAGGYVNITGNATAATAVLTASRDEMAAWAADSNPASNGRYGVSLNLVVTNTNNDPSITGSRTATESRGTTCYFGAAPATPAASATVNSASSATATAGDADLTAAVSVTGQGGDTLGTLDYQWECRVVSATPWGGTAIGNHDDAWRRDDSSATSSTYSIPTSNSEVYLWVPFDNDGTPETRWRQVKGDSLWKDYESVTVEYRCEVVNTEGTESVTGYSNTVTVTLNAPSFDLTVSGRDSDGSTTPPLRVTDTRTVTLSVTPQEGFSYEWVRYASMGAEYSGSLPESVIANAASLTITAADYSTSYPYYVCKITHTASGITRETARVYVGRENADGSAMAPVVTTGSNSLLCDVGGATAKSFSVTATSPDGGALSYQWQEYQDDAWTDLPGKTASSLALAGFDSAPCARSFRCVVANTKDESTATSSSISFYLTVRGVALEDVTFAPVAGQEFITTLTATVYGLPGESIAWAISGSDFGYTLTAAEATVPTGSSVAAVTATLQSASPQTATLNITATVGGTYEDPCSVTLNVVDFTIDTDKVTCGMGESMSETIAVTGTRPTGWSWTGDIPAGLSISDSGVISGTPTIPGTYPVTLKAGTAVKDCTVIVRSPAADKVSGDSGSLTIGDKVTGLTSDLSGTGWSWSGEAGVLTLDSSYPGGKIDFYSNNATPLYIRMKDNVTVEGTINCGNSAAGLYLYGSGSLTVTSPVDTSYAIYLGYDGTLYDKRTAGDLTVTNSYTGSSYSNAVYGGIDGAGSAGTVTIQNTAYGSAEQSRGVYGNVTCTGSGAVSITATIADSGTAACGVYGNLTQNGSGTVTVTVNSSAASANAATYYSRGVSGTLTQNGSGAVTVTVNQNAGQAGGVYGAGEVVLNSAGPVTITADGQGHAVYVGGTSNLTTGGSVSAVITGQNGTGNTVGTDNITLGHTGGSVTLNAAGSADIVRAVYNAPTDATGYIVSGAPSSGSVTYTAAGSAAPIFTVNGTPLTPDSSGDASYLLPLQQGETMAPLAVTAYCAGGCTLAYNDSGQPNGVTVSKSGNVITVSGTPGSSETKAGSFQIYAKVGDVVKATLTVNWTMSELKLISGPSLYRFDPTGNCQVRAGKTDQEIYFYAVGEKPARLQVFDGETKLYEGTDTYRNQIYSVDNGATWYPSDNVYCYHYEAFDASGMAENDTKTLTVKALDNSDNVLQSLNVTVTAVDPACPDYVEIGSGYGYYNLGLYDYEGAGWKWRKDYLQLNLNGYNGNSISSDGAPLKLFVQQSSSVSAIYANAGLDITGNSSRTLTINNTNADRAALTLKGNALTVDTSGSVSITSAGKVLDGASTVKLGNSVQMLRMEGKFANALTTDWLTAAPASYYLYNGTADASETPGVFLYGTGTNVPDFTVTVTGDTSATVGGAATLTAAIPAEITGATKNGTEEKAFEITYQWESSADGGSTWVDMSGKTDAALTPDTSTAGTVQYRCIVTVNGTKSQTSDPVTFTVSPAGVTVSGQVKSYNPGNATTIQLMQGGVEKYTTTIAATTGSGQVTQSFSIEGVAAGTYDLVVTKAGHLTYTITGVVVGSENLDLTKNANASISTITLLCGDVNGDETINSLDLNMVWKSTNYLKSTSDVGVEVITDVNGDGTVNSLDLNIIWKSDHYLKSKVSYTYTG